MNAGNPHVLRCVEWLRSSLIALAGLNKLQPFILGTLPQPMNIVSSLAIQPQLTCRATPCCDEQIMVTSRPDWS